MPVIKSRIDTASRAFAENAAHMQSLVNDLTARLEQVSRGGPAKARERHLKRGKLLARDRIKVLLDDGSPFMELSALAAYGLYEDDVPSAGIVTGIGTVMGRQCVIVANDATVKGGSLVPIAIKKHVRAQEIAEENGLGVI